MRGMADVSQAHAYHIMHVSHGEHNPVDFRAVLVLTALLLLAAFLAIALRPDGIDSRANNAFIPVLPRSNNSTGGEEAEMQNDHTGENFRGPAHLARFFDHKVPGQKCSLD